MAETAKGGKEAPKKNPNPASNYTALKVKSTHEDGSPKTLEVLKGTFQSANGAATARKSAFDAQPKEERDKGVALVAIPSRSFVVKTRKTKVTESSTEE